MTRAVPHATDKYHAQIEVAMMDCPLCVTPEYMDGDEPCRVCKGDTRIPVASHVMRGARNQFVFYAVQHALKVTKRYTDPLDDDRLIDIIGLHEAETTLEKALVNVREAIKLEKAIPR